MQYLIPIIILSTLLVVWLTAGVIVNKKLYSKVKKEEHQERGKVIQRIMKTYALIQCIVYPALAILGWFLYLNKTVLTIIQPSLVRPVITLSRFTFTLFRKYIGFNSLIIAVCRYSFIFYEDQVFKFGINRIRYIFLTSSVCIPLILGFLNEATIPIETVWYCFFAPRVNETMIGSGDLASTSLFCTKSNIDEITESPIYSLIHEYLSPSLNYAMEVTSKILVSLVFLNIIEGFIYFHTFVYIKG